MPTDEEPTEDARDDAENGSAGHYEDPMDPREEGNPGIGSGDGASSAGANMGDEAAAPADASRG